MLDLYNIIINDPVYITIAVILAIAVVFSVVKKLFKFAAILIAICVLYIGYLYYTGEEIPKTADDLIENVSEKTEGAVDGLREKSEDLKKKVKKVIKDKTP
jgi:predicted membrane protein